MRTQKIKKDILSILQDCKKHTIKEIADKIEVSYITVQRHIKELAERYPIQFCIGGRNSGGVFLKEVVFEKLFNDDERKLVLEALKILQHERQPENNEQFEALLEKFIKK